MQAIADLIDELASSSGGRHHCVANGKVCQEVHSLLVLLSFTLLQHIQQLRVLSDGMRRVELRRSMLAVQLATDAAPHKAHDVLCQSACSTEQLVRLGFRVNSWTLRSISTHWHQMLCAVMLGRST